MSAIYFNSLTKFPDCAGAATCIKTGTPNTSSNAMYVDSIFMYRGEFLINGRYFMPRTSVLCYEF